MGAHGAATRFFSVLIVLLGCAMVISTVARGGGPISGGVVLGLLFVAAGAARLYATLRSPR